MQTASEAFKELMRDNEFNEWFNSRPEVVKKLVEQYPFEKFRMAKDAPYGFSCPGQIVHLQSYLEDGRVGIIVLAKEFTAGALEHVQMKCIQYGTSFEFMKTKDVYVHIDPKYLIPIE